MPAPALCGRRLLGSSVVEVVGGLVVVRVWECSGCGSGFTRDYWWGSGYLGGSCYFFICACLFLPAFVLPALFAACRIDRAVVFGPER